MKIINSENYKNIDDFFNDFNESNRIEKGYKHLLHYESKNLDICFDCDEIDLNIHSLKYEIYKNGFLIGFLHLNDIKSINFWFISYQE